MWPLRSHPRQPAPGQPSRPLPELLALIGSPQDQATLAGFARNAGCALTTANTFAQALASVDRVALSVVLLDRDLSRPDWRAAVRLFSQHHRKPCVILVSSVVDSYLFDELIKQGGFDLVAKPIQADEIRRVGRLALAFWNSRHPAVPDAR